MKSNEASQSKPNNDSEAEALKLLEELSEEEQLKVLDYIHSIIA